jgi:hypothetical protein
MSVRVFQIGSALVASSNLSHPGFMIRYHLLSKAPLRSKEYA